MMIIWGAVSIAMLVIGFVLGPDDKEVVNQLEAMINCLGMLLASVGCTIMAYIMAILDDSMVAVILVSAMAGIAYYFFVMAMQCVLDYMRCNSEVPEYCKIKK